MTRLVLHDELLDAQTLRAAGLAPYGGADLGEVIATAGRITGTDADSWYDEWTATGQAAFDLAEAALAAGRRETAKLAYWRASTYFRTAGCLLLQPPLDDRLKQSSARQADAFKRGAELLAHPPEYVRIPYEDTTLPGYFMRPDDDPRQRATTLLMGGYDSAMEEVYFYNAAAALARGYNVLAFDGPGQGRALIDQGIVIRADWENVITPVFDFAVSRPDVDASRVALIGPSLGGHLAPRAASGEHRLAACIADCGAFDLFASFLDRMPEPTRSGFASGDSDTVKAVGQMLDQVAAQPTAGWALRRGLLVHGVQTPLDLVEEFRKFTLAGRAEKITCPTFVCNAEGDDISATAPQLVAALTCAKQFVTFTRAEGAGDHCEGAARTLYHARSFDWLDGILHPLD